MHTSATSSDVMAAFLSEGWSVTLKRLRRASDAGSVYLWEIRPKVGEQVTLVARASWQVVLSPSYAVNIVVLINCCAHDCEARLVKTTATNIRSPAITLKVWRITPRESHRGGMVMSERVGSRSWLGGSKIELIQLQMPITMGNFKRNSH